MQSRTLSTTAVIAVVLLAIGVGALLLAAGGTTDGAAPMPAGSAPAADAPPQAGRLSVFDRPAVALGAAYGYPDLYAHGGDLSRARRALVSERGSVFLVPTDDGMCLVSRALRERGCMRAEDVTERVLPQSLICLPSLGQDTIEVFGTFPDGATDIRVGREDGRLAPVRMGRNVFVFFTRRSEPRPTVVIWRQDGVEHQVPSTVPADFREDTCVDPRDLPSPARR